jgi:hypothetical protein
MNEALTEARVLVPWTTSTERAEIEARVRPDGSIAIQLT